MAMTHPALFCTAARALCAVTCALLLGADGYADTVRVGVSAPLTGVQSASGNDVVNHLRAAVTELNAGNAFGAHTVELVVADDGYDPELTRRNVRAMIERERVLLLMNQIGSANIVAALNVARGSGVCLFAPLAGPSAIYDDALRPGLVTLRASYADEAAQQAKMLASMAIERVAIVYQDDAFGQDVLAAWRRAIDAQNGMVRTQLVAAIPLARGDSNTRQAIKQALQADPGAVILPLAGSLATQAARQVREARVIPMLMSVGVTSETISTLSDSPTGGSGIVLFSSVMPLPTGRAVSPLLRDYAEFRARNRLSPSFRGLEAYVSIRALAAQLRKLPRPSASALASALAAPPEHVVADTAFRTRAPRHVDIYAITRTGVL